MSDEQIDDWINEWKDEMQNSVISVNGDYAIGTVDIGFGTNGLGTITTTDFKQIRRLWVTYDGSDWFHSTKMALIYPVPDQEFSSAFVFFAFAIGSSAGEIQNLTRKLSARRPEGDKLGDKVGDNPGDK